MRHTRALLTLASAGALLALAVPAQAAILDQGVDEFTETNGPLPCDGFTVTEQVEGRVEFTVKERRPDGTPYWSGRGVVDRTYINDATDRSWTSRETFFEHDTRVLSRAGDVVQMLVTNSFLFEVFDEGGKLDATNRGMAQWVLSIDTQGTSDPGDDEGAYAYPVRNHGAYEVGDFCQDAVRFTTG